jgi:hypothetical protein
VRTSRRAFLVAAAAPVAASLVSIGACARGDRAEVLVVGGGLAGLATLDRLVKAGRDARLLEAATRLGGRIFTVRDGMSAGLRAEMGAERVGGLDAGVRGLLVEHGLAVAPYPPPRQRLRLRWKGVSYLFETAKDLPEAVLGGLSEVERSGAPLEVLRAIVESSKPPAADDPRSGIEWLRASGMTKRGEELVRAFATIPLEGMPAPAFHRAAVREALARSSDTVAGGTDRLVERLGARHQGRITTGAAAVEAAQDGEGVTIVASSGRSFRAAHAVFCLPLAPLRALRFGGGTPEPLSRALRGLEIAHETKLAAETGGRDAPEYAFSERSVSWRLPETSARGTFVSQTLSWEPDAARGAPVPAPPGAVRHDFSADPLAGGAYAYARSLDAVGGVVRAGRLFFAGADLSDAPGWMEGAVRSADAAAAALGR